MATSYDYTDEFTKQLARKRRLAELLQQQSMSGLQLANPHARASFVNALVPLAQAWAGKSISDESNTEGTAHEAAQQKATQDAIDRLTQGMQGLPERPDMNLPGDLSALAPEATTRPPTDVSAPMLPQPSVPPPAAPMVPQPPQFNFSGSPKQKAELQAIAESDIRNQGAETLGPQGLTAPPPMPPPQPTPPPTLAGPPPPGALAAPPPLIPQPPGQPDMAPKGQMLPAQPGTTPNAFDMLKFAGTLPPGQQQQRFMDEALKNTLTEPDRRQAALERHMDRMDRTQERRDFAVQRSQDMALTREQRADWQKQAIEQKQRHDEQMLEYAKLIHPAGGGGGEGKPPSGYRWNADRTAQEFIPGGPADPETIGSKKQAAQIQITGGRESVYTNRVMQAAAQASKDLANIVQIPVEAQTTGLFGGRGQEHGLLNATKEVLAQKMTPQEAQTYNVMATGLQRALAAVETSGLAQGIQEFSKQIDVVGKEGETNLTKLHKLAQVRQIIEAGMESILANPRVPDEQKALVQKTLEGVQKSVPFTHSDLIELTKKQALDPDATMKDVITKTKEGKYVEIRKTPDGRTLGKKADGTIEEVK